jgi:hypothetical protein
LKVSLSTPNVSLKNERNIKQQQSFGSVADFLSKSIQFMDANPQSSIALIDLSSMIMPRTLIDAKEKNIPAGLETFRRESSGLVINCLTPGFLALGLAKLFKKSVLGEEFKHIPLDKLWANEETIDYLSGNWKKVQHLPDKRAQVEEFIKISFDKIQGADGAKNTVWTKIGDIPDNKSFYKELTNKVFAQKSTFSLDKDSLDSLSKSLTNKLGASKVIKHADGIPLRTNLKDLIRDTYSMTKAFADDSVTPQNIDLFTSKAKKLLNNKSFVAMGLIVSLALFMQKINRHITEKQTGQKGYVGYKNIKNEKSVQKKKQN